MTERVPVWAVAAGGFCLLLVYLSLQVRAGQDPAIGAGQPDTAAITPRKVVVRKVIVTRVIEDAAAAAPTRAVPAAAASPAPAAAGPAAPVVTRSS